MKSKDALELHREEYERRQRDLEALKPARGRDHVREQNVSVGREAPRPVPLHRNGHKSA